MYLYCILSLSVRLRPSTNHYVIYTQYPLTALHNTLLAVTLELVLPCASTRESYNPIFSSVKLNVHHVAESCTVEPLVL